MSNLTKTITIYSIEKRADKRMEIVGILSNLRECEEMAQTLIDNDKYTPSQLRVCEKTVYTLDGSGWL